MYPIKGDKMPYFRGLNPFMKYIQFILIACLFAFGCSGQEKVSEKKFPEISLVNKISFYNPKYDQSRFSCGFLIKYGSDTFAVTAKHLLKIIRTDKMKTVAFGNEIRSWSMYPLNKEAELIITDKLLNDEQSDFLDAKSTYDKDWLLFSIEENHSQIKPLEIRKTALNSGEKLYAVGWTRTMTSGSQRVYEFEYYKTIGNRLLLKDVIVPENFGGLSGAPVVDEQGLVVGIVSGGTTDPATDKKYFSPCSLESMVVLLEKLHTK